MGVWRPHLAEDVGVVPIGDVRADHRHQGHKGDEDTGEVDRGSLHSMRPIRSRLAGRGDKQLMLLRPHGFVEHHDLSVRLKTC